jgi:hypothetical protein
MPKSLDLAYDDMTLQVVQKGGGLDAKVLSVRRSRAEP